MAELMGIAGADSQTTRRVLDTMENHIAESCSFQCDRSEEAGVGVLHFHHGKPDNGLQPARSENGALCVYLDGYLLPEDPDKTADCQEKNDAEHLLHLYEQEGEGCFPSLNGSYSIAIYDSAARSFLLVTDRILSRPMFYAETSAGLLFGSRFNALAVSPALENRQLDMTALAQLLTFQHVQFRHTLLKEIRCMKPASVLEFRGGHLNLRKYWRIPYGSYEQSETDRAEKLAHLLRRAAERITARWRNTGLLLSGGLDSRLVVAACQTPLSAYTVADWNCREVRLARRVAAGGGGEHTFIRRPADYYSSILDEAIELTGGMERFDTCHFPGFLDIISEDCDLVLNEDAMDPLFRGYYWGAFVRPRGLRIPLPARATFSRRNIEEQILHGSLKSTFGARPWLLFREPFRGRYYDAILAGIGEQIKDAGTDDPYHLVEHVSGLAAYGRTLSGLRSVRKAVEYGALSFDSDLWEFAFALPLSQRMDGRLLRQALRLLDGRLFAIPDSNTGFRPDVPAFIGWMFRAVEEASLSLRRKLGLIPVTWRNMGWPDRSEELRTPAFRRLLTEMLADEESFPPDIIDIDRAKQMVEEHMSRKKNHVAPLRCLITFGRWHKLYGPSRTE
ncbi:MAG: asparagine synthase-related protein [Candidatus Brocadiia bacterium]